MSAEVGRGLDVVWSCATVLETLSYSFYSAFFRRANAGFFITSIIREMERRPLNDPSSRSHDEDFLHEFR